MKSNIASRILDNMTQEEQLEYEEKIQEFMDYHDQLKVDGKIFNTNTSISIEILKKHGFNPIAITQMYLEETFVFSSLDESNLAYEQMEKKLNLISGWWYDEVDFNKEYEEYCVEMGYKPQIYYLDGR